MNTKELKEKLEELVNIDENNQKALVVLRCFDKDGNPQDIPIYDAMSMYIFKETDGVYALKTFEHDKYDIKIEGKENKQDVF